MKNRADEESYAREVAMQRKLEGYRKYLIANGTYAMDCPYCGGALSKDDIKRKLCRHCGHPLPWNTVDD